MARELIHPGEILVDELREIEVTQTPGQTAGGCPQGENCSARGLFRSVAG